MFQLTKLISQLRKNWSESHKTSARLDLNENGFLITWSNNTSRFVLWKEITEIYAYKRDLYTVDMICLSIGLGKNNEAIEVNEEMLNLFELTKGFSQHLSGFDSEWHTEVVLPSFKLNMRKIYDRSNYKTDQ